MGLCSFHSCAAHQMSLRCGRLVPTDERDHLGQMGAKWWGAGGRVRAGWFLHLCLKCGMKHMGVQWTGKCCKMKGWSSAPFQERWAWSRRGVPAQAVTGCSLSSSISVRISLHLVPSSRTSNFQASRPTRFFCNCVLPSHSRESWGNCCWYRYFSAGLETLLVW